MLATFRKLLEGPGKYVLGLMIILAFGVVGLPTLSNFGRSKAIEVGDRGFTAQEVEREFRRRFQRAQAESEEPLTQEDAVAAGLLRDAVSSLTVQALVLEEAEQLGLSTTDEMVQAYLREQPVFTDPDSGEFDSALVRRYLTITNQSVTELRDTLRVELIQQQVASSVALNQPGPSVAADFVTLRQGEVRETSVAVLTPDNLAEPTEADLQSYYEANTARYQRPEFRTFTFVALSEDAVRDRVTINEDEVRQLFDARAELLGTPETRSFAQARFNSAEAAEAALQAIEGGADFADAAAEAGASVTNVARQSRDTLADRAVAEAAFGIEEPGVAGPVDGVFGVVLLNVTEIVPGTEVTFEDVREDLEAELFAEIFGAELDALYDEIQEAGDTGASLSAAAEGVGLEAENLGPVALSGVTPTGTTLEIEPATLQTAFSAGADGFFEEVRLADGGYGFIQVEDITAAATKPYEEVADQVALDAAAEARATALTDLVAQIRLSVTGGQSFEEAVASVGGTAATRTLTVRSSPEDLPPQLVDDIFFEPVGTVISAPGGGGASMTVAQVSEVKFEALPPGIGNKNAIRAQLGSQMSQDQYRAYIAALEESVGVKTNEALLAQRFGAGQ